MNTATAHERRVTLNLLRHAACCPSKLLPTLELLADLDWNFDRVPKADLEVIYALVDGELADAAVEEFYADTTSIVDLKRSGFPEEECFCKLCGQQHIRWEFTLCNSAGGRDAKTGSVCIETYGLRVDGEGTAEEALKRLREAIASAKKTAEREDWQEEYPNHRSDMEEIRIADVDLWESKFPPADVPWALLESNWVGRRKEAHKRAKAVLKYYDREAFLTPLRTKQVYGPEGLLVRAREMTAEVERARTRRWGIVSHWDKVLARPLSPHQRRRVEYWRSRVTAPEKLGGYDLDIYNEIIGVVEDEEPVDNSDLPF